jgi:branched-subunit amino acid transport protein
MPETEIWLIIVLGGLATYLTRMSFIVLIPPDRLPEALRRALRFVPAAVLSALILPDLLLREGALSINLANHRLLAGIIAAVVAWRTRNTWLTIGAGMLALWGLSLL